jgi:hypothetical protein
MKKIKLINILLFTLCFYESSIAQEEKPRYYFVTGKDSTFCTFLKYYTNNQGYLTGLSYTDLSGKKVYLDGKKNVPDVKTFAIGGYVVDKVPINPDKPEGYVRYLSRDVDGKLIVYCPERETRTEGTYNNGFRTHNYGPEIYFLKMPDGTIYKVNKKKNMEDYIKPYLLACKEFSKQYKGDFTDDQKPFMETIELYNSLCK